MRLTRPSQISLRVTLSVSVVVVVIAAVHLYTLRPEKRFFEQKMRESERVAIIIETHLLAEMKAGEPDNIQNHLELLPANAGIHRVEVVDPEMVVHFSSDGSRLGNRLDRREDAPCKHCHLLDPPPERIVYESENDGRIFAVDHVLSNDAECQRCHEDAGPILGNILVEISLTEHDVAALEARRRLMIFAGVLLLTMLVALAVTIHFLVGRPAATLMDKMRRVEGGEFEVGVARRSRDEFGVLERGFHGMVERLRVLYTEMEAQIQERTRSLYETQAQVVHQEKLAGIGQLAAGVAHEIGNPLTAIDSMVQLLTAESDDDNVREKSRVIQGQVDRISEIVHAMADLSRPLSLDVEPVNVNAVIYSVLRLVKYDARFREIELLDDLDESLPRVPTVEDRLFGVFLNLALNAADAMPEGGSLRISTAVESDGVMVSFADTGDGIPEDDIARVFDSYFTTKAPGKGTGLGLSVCKAYFDSIGGYIDVDSEVGRGTTFRMRLPLDDKDAGK